MNRRDAVQAVLAAIEARSQQTRTRYLDGIREMADASDSDRGQVGCSNLAHAAAGALEDQAKLLTVDRSRAKNLAIVTAYNDMLSAHQPYENYPDRIKQKARSLGAMAQVAGGVPAMCDGVTQGRPGMELSLLSRDVIAMSTAVALSHNVYDATVALGICDKIVPGLLMGALSFGHLPTVFIPAGPMQTGISNDAKSQVRKAFAKGEVGREELLASEAAAYHSPGTCTFYGTANSNQMLLEMMGVQLPGSSFINPGEEIRGLLTDAAVEAALNASRGTDHYLPIGLVIDARAIVNAIIGLHATGGSTNHTMHLIAIAQAAGLSVTWNDFAALSKVTPLIARVYPNGSADVNHFHAAGGMGYVMRELLDAGLLLGDALSMTSRTIAESISEPLMTDGALEWVSPQQTSLDPSILKPVDAPFQDTGGLVHLTGNIGEAVIKTSAVDADRHVIEAQCFVFDNEEHVKTAFKAGELNRDVVVVVRGQGPKANGMPELHGLTPSLSVLQDQGYRVALVTDGRMSGASGKVPAAIHVSPEAKDGGPLSRIQTGDVIRLDASNGELIVLVDQATLDARQSAVVPEPQHPSPWGRSLFSTLRHQAGPATLGGGLQLLPEA
jgi:phosphogluconate dehydratase